MDEDSWEAHYAQFKSITEMAIPMIAAEMATFTQFSRSDEVKGLFKAMKKLLLQATTHYQKMQELADIPDNVIFVPQFMNEDGS